jgi:ArsR family transcriptional regulator
MKTKLPKQAFAENAEIYKILANPKRLEILNILRDTGGMSVESLAECMDVSVANVSQHLRILRLHRLVTTERNGLHICYRIIDPRIVEPCRILHALRSATLTDK